MLPNRELAVWLVAKRREIELSLARRLGPAAPAPGAPETEMLRRFRSFAAVTLQRGQGAAPALDGLRVNERRAMALLSAWSEAALEQAGERSSELGDVLEALIARFRTSLRGTSSSRRTRGAPRAARRAVMAAIDRVADAFLAIDADDGRIVDANPAAGSLLGVARDALLGVEATAFVAAADHGLWWTQLDAMTEGADPLRFAAGLSDATGSTIAVECTATRYASRGRTLALVVARPAHP